MRIRTSLAVVAAIVFVACSGSDGGPTDPGPPDDRAFSPTTDTELSGSVDFDEVSIPAGVTVRVTGDLTVRVEGPIVIAGDLVGECVSIEITGETGYTQSGSISNTCDPTPVEPPGITIVGNGPMIFDGSVLESTGTIETANGPDLLADANVSSPGSTTSSLRPAQEDRHDVTFANHTSRIIGDAAAGSPALPTAGDGEPGADIRHASLGRLEVRGNSQFVGQRGGKGGSATAEANSSTVAHGGKGGRGGEIFLLASFQDRLVFSSESSPTLLHLGAGGEGGDADATSLENPANPEAPSAMAVGGDGGSPGNLHLNGSAIEVEPGALVVRLGDGGAGGRALAQAADGVDATAERPAQAGGAADASGGAGGRATSLSSRDLIDDLPSTIALEGGAGGEGGAAFAFGGNGGDGICSAFPDGARGGTIGGGGGHGEASFRSPFDPFPYLAPGGTGGNVHLLAGDGGRGANCCGSEVTITAEGEIAVKSDPAGSDPFLFGATTDGIAFVLEILRGSGRSEGGDGGPGGSTHRLTTDGSTLPSRVGDGSNEGAPTGDDGGFILEHLGNGGPAGSGLPPGNPGPPGNDFLIGTVKQRQEPVLKAGPPANACTTGTLVPSQELRSSQTGVEEITISGEAPWIGVTGTLAEDGTVTAEGTGTMVGFPGVKATFEGTFADGRLQGDYAMDTEKKVSSGHPIVYTVDVQRQ